MKNVITIITLFLITLNTIAQSKNFLDVSYLETSAQVDTLVSPDKIYLNITIKEKDSKGRKSVEEQENKMAKSLKNLGIDIDKQLTIKDLASNYKKYFLRSKEVLKSKCSYKAFRAKNWYGYTYCRHLTTLLPALQPTHNENKNYGNGRC